MKVTGEVGDHPREPEDATRSPTEGDLRIMAVENGVMLTVLSFVLGGFAGWWVTGADRPTVERLVGLGIAIALLCWAVLAYHRSRGLMAR